MVDMSLCHHIDPSRDMICGIINQSINELWTMLPWLREVFKKKKKKKCGIFHISVFYPPPRQNVEIYSFFFTIFLDVLAHFKHIREKKYFSP